MHRGRFSRAAVDRFLSLTPISPNYHTSLTFSTLSIPVTISFPWLSLLRTPPCSRFPVSGARSGPRSQKITWVLSLHSPPPHPSALFSPTPFSLPLHLQLSGCALARSLAPLALVAGSLLARGLAVRNLTVTGKMSVGTTLTANKVSATLLSADVVETGTLAAKAGDTIIVDGDFELTGDANGAGTGGGNAGMSFLATDVVVNGVRQWHLIHFDDFEGGSGAKKGEEVTSDDASAAEGWSHTHTSSCDEAGKGDTFLGGACALGGDTLASKTYHGLPLHTSVRITASFHFLDNWEGETGFAKVDGKYAWADMADTSKIHPARGLNVCGGDHPDAKIGAPIDITMPHTGASVELAFGAMLKGKDPCDASFGVDNVMVYVR